MRQGVATEEYDAVVIGGGPHGLTYAHWLREMRPGTRIAVVEKNEKPGFKIGESTLSAATRSMVATGIPMPVLRRLFGNKAGIRFWWTDSESEELQEHIDIVDIEETFQVERRVLDIALQEAVCKHPEVTMLKGRSVDLKRSTLEGSRKSIVCMEKGGTERRLESTLLCDASGPAALLARHRKTLRKDPGADRTFSTNAYYAYFRGEGPEEIPHWKEPATRHICFPGGWTWFIKLVTWEESPEENLRAMVRYLLDHPEGPDESYPSREELCERFGCRYDTITSVGFVVRADRDRTDGMNAEASFRAYADSNPAIRSVLDRYEVVDSPYDRRPTWGAFYNMLHRNSEPTGDGLIAIGDAALFVNPIFSPGMNLGSGTCYLAAKLSAEALETGNVTSQQLAPYRTYLSSLYDALVAETDLYYRSFDDRRTYELALTLKLFYGAADVITKGERYDDADLNTHGLLNQEFRQIVDGVRLLLRGGEADQLSPEEIYRRTREVVRPFISRVLDRPEVRRLRIGSLFSDYNGRGDRVAKVRRRRAAFGVRQCRSCRSWSDRSIPLCPVCAAPSPRKKTIGVERST